MLAATRPIAVDADLRAARQAGAWLLLSGCLALHVIDEAATGFLSFYNPLVLELRSRFGWFPMPTFTFGVWIAGLAVAIVLAVSMTNAVRRGAAWTQALAWFFSILMLLNGLGHLLGSVYFGRWLPGATSSPFLLVASVMLVRATLARSRGRA